MSNTVLAQGGGQSIFLLPNGTFFAELIIILVVLGILGRFVWPPIHRAMNDRHARVEQQLEDSDRAAKRFAEADQRYREALSEARNESAKIRDEARSEGNRIIEEMRSQADAEVAQIRERGESQLAEQRERVVTELRGSVGELSARLAGRVVGVQLEGPAIRSRAEELLGETAAGQRAGSVEGGSA